MLELRKLENTKQYLFHGTLTKNIQEFEPRQAYSHGKKDGAPCVAASEFFEPAVFMAVLGSRKLGGWTTDRSNDILYYLLRSELDTAIKEDWTGYVYLFDRDTTKFSPYQNWEWRTHIHVKPSRIIKVGIPDLPKNIKLLDNYNQYNDMADKGR